MSETAKNLIYAFGNDQRSGKKIGLFFGSFNPIHVGHMILANHMVNYTDLDEIWFVVSPQNPHKTKSSLLSEHHRLSMVNEAVGDNPKFRASDIEFQLSKPSYTIDTLAYLEERYPDHKFALLMGEDNLRSFHKWKNHEVILDKFPILVYPRVLTIQEQEKEQRIEKHELLNHQNIHLVDAPITKISSSFIRRAIADGLDVKYLLTEPVWRYLDEMNFYK